MKIFILVLCLFILSKNIGYSSELVEIHLLDNLDDDRGFCIDIKGHKSRAKIERGIQAHTCYSYQGQISIDQGFKKHSLTNSSFYILGFSVCMKVKSVNFKHEVILGKCDNMNLDSLTFSENNQIHLTKDKSYCLTVIENSLRSGKGGSPIHKMRDIELLKCNKNINYLQKWGYRN
tara:strand:- start:1835 stop:2362 length:528 start_codon:yes stop_codon:yes gene_type:complete